MSQEKQLQQLHQVQESLHSAIKDLISGTPAQISLQLQQNPNYQSNGEVSSSSSSTNVMISSGGHAGDGDHSPGINFHGASELMDPITLEIEKERIEYLEKSKNLQHQLKDLKSEIEKLKLEDKQSPYDIIHQEQVQSGENKYSTLRKIKSGSTKSRVAFFEEL